jgi:hypothetical protein
MREPMVLRALLALSAAHKRKFLDPANRARDGLVPDAQEVFLLKQHGNAIKNLQRFLADGSETTRQRLLLAVIMCSLLVLMEYGRGRYDVGYLHLKSGAQLAKRLIEEFCSRVCGLKLAQFFPRLLDQAGVYRARKCGASASVVKPILRFLDMEEAGHHLDEVIDILAHTAKELKRLPPLSVAHREMPQVDWEISVAWFKAWLLAYDATLKDLGPDAETEAWRALRLRYDTAMRMADVGAKEGVAETSMKEADSWMESQRRVLVIL